MLMYYPLAQRGRYKSLGALCKSTGIPRANLEPFITNAAMEKSELVVCDQMRLGDPEDQMCAVLQFDPAGGVTLWVGVFSEASESRADVERFLENNKSTFAEIGITSFAVGEFLGRPGAMQ